MGKGTSGSLSCERAVAFPSEITTQGYQMGLGTYVRLSNAPERWVCAIEQGYRLAVVMSTSDRRELMSTLMAGQRFSSVEGFAAGLDACLDVFDRLGILDVVRSGRFSANGARMVDAALSGGQDSRAVVSKFVGEVIFREIQVLIQMSNPWPVDSESRRMVDDKVQDAVNAYLLNWTDGFRGEYRVWCTCSSAPASSVLSIS